jgi:hypothetical protein
MSAFMNQSPTQAAVYVLECIGGVLEEEHINASFKEEHAAFCKVPVTD